MFVEDYTWRLAELASHGYVVAAVGYPGTSLVSFDDGAIGLKSAWRPPSTLSMRLGQDRLRSSWAFFQSPAAYLARDRWLAMQQGFSGRTLLTAADSAKRQNNTSLTKRRD